MRTLTSAATTAVAGPVTLPGYFVEILFDTPQHWSSRETIVWGGNTWLTWDIKITGLGTDAAQSSARGSLQLGNTDYSVGSLVLNQGIVDRPISVWKFYGSSPGPTDPVAVFSGVGADFVLDPTQGQVTIGLQQAGGRSQFSPRRYITAEQGFSYLPASGTIINWNNEIFILEANNRG